jgi:nonribosomal peptide synthetase CepA
MTGTVVAAEATLCRIFADVLGLDVVHPGDAFFDVGGDSVLALQVVARAHEAGLDLGVRDLFDNQTPGTLAAVAGELADTAAEDGTAAPTAVPLLTYSSDELEEFESVGLVDEFEATAAGQQASDAGAGWQSDTEGGWETVT